MLEVDAVASRWDVETLTPRCPFNAPWLAAQEVAVVDRVAAQVGDDRTLEEHERPIGDGLHLLGVARHDEAGDPAARQGVDLTVDVDAGADIDALRRLDEEQHVGVAHQPAGQHDLLLVAATEDADRARQSTVAATCTLPAARDDLLALAPGGQDRQDSG